MSDVPLLEFNTKNLETRKRVKIDGHEYSVRPAGAGDDMKMNIVLAKLKKLDEEIVATKRDTTAKDYEAIALIQKEGIKIVSDRYDDGGNGTKSFKLISSLAGIERIELEKHIFGLVALDSIASLEGLDEVEAKAQEAIEKVKA